MITIINITIIIITIIRIRITVSPGPILSQLGVDQRDFATNWALHWAEVVHWKTRFSSLLSSSSLSYSSLSPILWPSLSSSCLKASNCSSLIISGLFTCQGWYLSSKIYFSQVTKRKGKMRNVLTTVHCTIWLQVGVVRPPSYLFKSCNDHFDYLQGWCWWWCPSNMKPVATCRKMRGQPGGGESSSWSLARPRSSRQPPSPSRHNLKVQGFDIFDNLIFLDDNLTSENRAINSVSPGLGESPTWNSISQIFQI